MAAVSQSVLKVMEDSREGSRVNVCVSRLQRRYTPMSIILHLLASATVLLLLYVYTVLQISDWYVMQHVL